MQTKTRRIMLRSLIAVGVSAAFPEMTLAGHGCCHRCGCSANRCRKVCRLVRKDRKITTTGFVLTTGNNNSSAGPELVNYPGDCVAGNRLQLTRGNRLIYGAPGHTMYNHVRGPNDLEVDCRGALPHSQRNFYWWSRLSHNVASHSRHTGGVQSLFCDGHVQFISDTVDVSVWRSFGSRSSGEVVGEI